MVRNDLFLERDSFATPDVFEPSCKYLKFFLFYQDQTKLSLRGETCVGVSLLRLSTTTSI